jgi:hypothetical protein
MAWTRSPHRLHVKPHAHSRAHWLAVLAFALVAVVRADVLPEDRMDILYHRYEGGGLTVQGPSLLVSKRLSDSVSVSYQYYVDLISSASIDVVTQASKYKERRTQNNVGLDYLRGSTLYSIGWINSNEPDYKSNTGFGSISQSMFGDLTTVTFGFTRGWDVVGKVEHGIPQDFRADADHRNWSLGISQVLTRNLLLGLNFETDESEGYLHSPYRSVRYVDPTVARGYSYQPEVYPDTRTGNAASAQLKYYLPWHASVSGTYRFYTDTWGIVANQFNTGYTQALGTHWTLDASLRYYWQTHATFYSDLFPYESSQNFMARDRELAQFTSITGGVGATWLFRPSWPHFIDHGTVNLEVNHLHISYADFRNALVTDVAPQDEPLYTLDATIYQFFISFWY